MSLIENMMDNCVMLDKKTVSDGLGGFISEWSEGAEFKAAIVKDTSLQATVAEKEGITEIYTITVDKNLKLDFHDIFKRLKDGAIFRVTSNITDSESPDVSTLNIGQVKAERWQLK